MQLGVPPPCTTNPQDPPAAACLTREEGGTARGPHPRPGALSSSREETLSQPEHPHLHPPSCFLRVFWALGGQTPGDGGPSGRRARGRARGGGSKVRPAGASPAAPIPYRCRRPGWKAAGGERWPQSMPPASCREHGERGAAAGGSTERGQDGEGGFGAPKGGCSAPLGQREVLGQRWERAGKQLQRYQNQLPSRGGFLRTLQRRREKRRGLPAGARVRSGQALPPQAQPEFRRLADLNRGRK